MDDALKHLRAVHFLLLLTAGATTYFNFGQNTDDKRLMANLRWMLREGPYEEVTFADMGQEKLAKYPVIYRNYYRLSYRQVDEIPAIISELKRASADNSTILGIKIESTFTAIVGSLAQLFILCYIHILVSDARTALKLGNRIPSPTPWVGAMPHRRAKLMVWLTLFIIPTGSSTFAFLYFPSFWGIALVSVPIALVGFLVSRECGRLSDEG